VLVLAGRQTLPELLDEADEHALALVNTSRQGLTYGQLRDQCGRMRDLLARRGIATHDTVAVALPNSAATAALLTALVSCCRVAPLNPASTRSEFAFALRDTSAKVLITSDPLAEAIAAARDCGIETMRMLPVVARPGTFELECDTSSFQRGAESALPEPDDIALVLHTSGTTARPKLVGITHRSLVLSARSVAETLQLGPADTCLSIMPLFHVHGFVAGLFASFARSATVCSAPGFYAMAFTSWLESSGASWYTAAPAMHQAILSRLRAGPLKRGQHRLRLIRSCSSTLYPKVWTELQSAFGVAVLNAYGMTEAAHQVSSVRWPGSSCTSVGQSSGPDIGIMNSEGGLLPTGDVGEVVLRGPQIISAYLQPKEANGAAFCRGWFRTGDKGYLDSSGALALTGRLKELIDCGGDKVSPYEVEEVLLRHPGVDQAVAFGRRDALRGEVVVAAVVMRDGWQVPERELLRLAAEHLARPKQPRRIVFLSRIPQAGTGKVQRLGLAQRLGVGS